jgi:hypothetical protein
VAGGEIVVMVALLVIGVSKGVTWVQWSARREDA